MLPTEMNFVDKYFCNQIQMISQRLDMARTVQSAYDVWNVLYRMFLYIHVKLNSKHVTLCMHKTNMAMFKGQNSEMCGSHGTKHVFCKSAFHVDYRYEVRIEKRYVEEVISNIL